MNAADAPPVALAEALGRLAEMPAVLSRALEGRGAESLRQRTAAGGEFSLVEHACHLRDVEREGYLVRVHRVLAEDSPELPGFPGGEIAEQRDYRSQDAHAAARDFAAARSELLAMLATLQPAQLCREARFGDGTITLAELVAMIVDHDRGHREEIRALEAALAVP